MGLRLPERRLLAAGALFVATVAWRLFTFTGFTNDHYAHVALAQQMLLGDRPVRDFSDPGWPLMYLLSAAAWRVAGNAMWVEWSIVATAIALGSALSLIAAHRLSGSLAIAVLVTMVQVLMSPRSYAFPKIVAYAAFAAVIVAGAAPSRRRLVLLGVVIAIAFLLRHDHAVWIGFGSAAYLACSSRSFGPATLVQRATVVAGTTALVLAPWAAFIVANGGLVPYFSTALEYARAEANASALRTWPTFTLTGETLLAANADAWLFWLLWSVPAAASMVAVRRWRRRDERWPGELAVVGALVVVAAGVNAGFLRDVLRTRLADAIVPAAILAAWLLGTVFTTPWRARAAQRFAQLGAAAVCATSLAAIASATELSDRFERTNYNAGPAGMYRRLADVIDVLRLPHRQVVMPTSRVTAALVPFFEYLDRCTSDADRLIVTGEYPDIVVLSGRGFAGDGVVFGAWYSSATNQGRTLQRLRSRPALFVILLDEPGFGRRFPVIAKYVGEEYGLLATVREPGVEVPILMHRGRAADRGEDSETGWPCFR